MPSILMLYNDPECKQQASAWVPGAVAFFGQMTYPYNWGSLGGCIYWAGAIPQGQAVFSGGSVIYNYAISQTLPYSDIEENADTLTENPQTVKINHRLFIGRDDSAQRSYLFSLECYPQSYPYQGYTFTFLSYTQAPWDGTRQTWLYERLAEWVSYPPYIDGNYNCVKIFRGSVAGVEYYFIAFNIAADNTTSSNIFLVGVPLTYFDGSYANYVGETAEDDSETAFMPPDGGEWHDSITTRTNYDVNPYGVNQGGGLKVIFPTVGSGGTIYPLGLQYIINGIYRGKSEGILNSINQAIADATGGNANRPAEEVQAIISAIMSLHSVPVIYPTGTAGSYASVATTFQTVSGYEVTWLSLSVTSPGQKTIFEWAYTTDVISRRLNCFLDFEPYTTIILKLPFFPPVQLSPSALFGHRLQIDYKIDILTGLLSADVSTTDDGGTYYILTTMQGNVKTSIPIMGQGAQNAVLEKITGAIVSTAKEGPAGAFSGALSVSEEVAKSAHGVAVGHMSVDGLGAYLSPRAAYLICTHPVAAIPASYSEEGAIVGDFLDNIGMAANLGGKVGDFAGGFASFSAVDLSGFEATDAEKAAIMALLKGGVYL